MQKEKGNRQIFVSFACKGRLETVRGSVLIPDI